MNSNDYTKVDYRNIIVTSSSYADEMIQKNPDSVKDGNSEINNNMCCNKMNSAAKSNKK